MARDKNTFNLLNNYFDNNSFLAPDIVLTSVISNNRKFNNTILMCMRTDIEKSVNPIVENEIKLYLKGKGYDIDVIDTETYSKILRSESEYIVETTIRKFANAHYVVTDRLHGLIFANITGTPCLAIDNKTKKISGFYELWIDKNHNILFDSNISISLQIDKLLILQKYDYSNRASLAAINNIIDQVIGGADK